MYFLYLHGGHFIDIETTAPLLKILDPFNGFISLSNTNSNIYQISLGTELYCCSARVFLLEKIIICWHMFLVHIFLFRLNFYIFYIYEILNFLFKDALLKLDFFKKICRMENKSFIKEKAKCIRQFSKSSMKSTKKHRLKIIYRLNV